MKCAARTYADFDKTHLPDYEFEQDTDFFLQSIGAAQEFYLAIVDLHLGVLNTLTFGVAGLVKNIGVLMFPIITLIL